MRKTGFGKILAALFATSMVGTMLASVTPTAQAAQQSYAFSTIQKIYDGTGHGTPAQTFIQTKNGFSPADDTPTDGVVATNDFVQYEVTTQFAAGPEREVVVDFQAPEFLTFSLKDNLSLCASNQFVSSRYTGSSTHGQCTYSLKRGVPITVKVPLTMRGGDTAGVAISGQSMGVKTGDELAEAPSVTVVSAPQRRHDGIHRYMQPCHVYIQRSKPNQRLGHPHSRGTNTSWLHKRRHSLHTVVGHP